MMLIKPVDQGIEVVAIHLELITQTRGYQLQVDATGDYTYRLDGHDENQPGDEDLSGKMRAAYQKLSRVRVNYKLFF